MSVLRRDDHSLLAMVSNEKDSVELPLVPQPVPTTVPLPAILKFVCTPAARG